jgi:hypothetical protein
MSRILLNKLIFYRPSVVHLWNLKFHYRFRKRMQMELILSQITRVTLIPDFAEICYYIILPYACSLLRKEVLTQPGVRHLLLV